MSMDFGFNLMSLHCINSLVFYIRTRKNHSWTYVMSIFVLNASVLYEFNMIWLDTEKIACIWGISVNRDGLGSSTKLSTPDQGITYAKLCLFFFCLIQNSCKNEPYRIFHTKFSDRVQPRANPIHWSMYIHIRCENSYAKCFFCHRISMKILCSYIISSI